MTGITICPHCWKEQRADMRELTYNDTAGMVDCEFHGAMSGKEVISLYQAQGIPQTGHPEQGLPRYELGTADK